MDLADIRKKARDGKLNPKTPAAAPSAPQAPTAESPSAPRAPAGPAKRAPAQPAAAMPAAAMPAAAMPAAAMPAAAMPAATMPAATMPAATMPAATMPAATPPEERDRLAELFELPGGFEPATEESYLAGLERSRHESREDLRRWLTLSLGNETYALDIRQISEIIKPREVTEVPRTPDFILGIISLRGIIVPVFDLGRRLRLAPAQVGPAARIIVCQAEGRNAGLLVDRISQVVNIPEGAIEPPPPVLSGLDRDLLAGVGRFQERMLILLHLPSVLNAELV
jgi:purine-binding chemotaxis protein CheW